MFFPIDSIVYSFKEHVPVMTEAVVIADIHLTHNHFPRFLLKVYLCGQALQ